MSRTLLYLMYATAMVAQSPKPTKAVRIFVGESASFFSSSFGAASATTGAIAGVAGVEKWTIPTMKALSDKCGDRVIIVSKADDADYFVRIDRNGGLIRRTEMAIFNRSGEMVFVASSSRTGAEAKRFCKQLFPPPPKKKRSS